MMLLRNTAAEEIGLHGLPIIQSCRGMNSAVERSMELVELRIRGLKEPEEFLINDVKVTEMVPELEHSLPNTLDVESFDDFKDLVYPIIDRNHCDMLIEADNIHLLTWVEETNVHRISGDLHATHLQLGWVISGWEPDEAGSFQLIEDNTSNDVVSDHEFDVLMDDANCRQQH